MGRKSSSSRPAPRAAPAPAHRSTPPPPAARSAAPPPALAPSGSNVPAHPTPSSGGGMLAGLGATMMQGMAFGAGSSVGHRVVDGIMGSGGSSQAPQPVAPVATAPVQANSVSGACALDMSAFNLCMKQNNNNVQACESYFSALQACQQSNGM